MKEIELLKSAEEGCCYDDELGYYKVIKEGINDIIIVRNMEYKEMKLKDISIMGNINEEYIIETKTNYQKHVVKPLESIQNIANKYNTSVNEIISKNQLKTERLFIGQILNI